MFARSFLVLGILLSVGFPAWADQQTIWTSEKIAGLFPDAEEGWSAEDAQIEELKTMTSDFEAFAGALAGSDVGASVRLRVTRKYVSGEKSRKITIDSQDIDTASTITALEQLAETGDARLEEFAAKGVHRATYAGVPSLRVEGEISGRVLRLTQSGILALECDTPNCGGQLEDVVATLDIDAIKAFLTFDHRR